MDKRIFLFLTISAVVLLGSELFLQTFFPAPDEPAVEEVAQDKKGKAADGKNREDKAQGDKAQGDKQKTAKAKPEQKANSKTKSKAGQPRPEAKPPGDKPAQPPAGEADAVPLKRVTLGSLDPKSGARMLVTITNQGAAVERIELNERIGDTDALRFRDLSDTSGYLGHLDGSTTPGGGCLVNVVGAGTPAAQAGLKVGDVITAIDGKPVSDAASLNAQRARFRPRDTIELSVRKKANGKTVKLKVKLMHRPLEVVRPELGTEPQDVFLPGEHDQLSLLMTLEQLGDRKLAQGDSELKGIQLRYANWKITRQTPWEVELQRAVGDEVTVVRRYQLAQADPQQLDDQDAPVYHLTVDLEIRNTADHDLDIAYRLDGATGLPTEGWWWSSKIGRNWGGRRLRDAVWHTLTDGPVMFDTSLIVEEDEEGYTPKPLRREGDGEDLVAYVGMETQYFAAVLIPRRADEKQQLFDKLEVALVGDVPQDSARLQLSNATCRAISQPSQLKPGQSLKQSFVFFAGPKRRELLAQYGPDKYPTSVTLDELIYYGYEIWGWFAKPLTLVLHFFYSIVGNYGLAIIMLTVVVRLCMFPLSRKQAINAQKMQELQPEMKKITEKYKNDLEKRSKAIQDMYRKNNYNPLSGCLPVFIQLPIFIGLYRALMTDIGLRQAPLLSHSISWADNLAAPDRLWHWEGLLPILVTETGWLGPYLNILPLITVALFLWQQKMFMPPPADEQAAMQQKIMQYMMILMGVIFFKVPSGLCLYFIASSLWGIGERKLLPKTQPPKEGADSAAKPTPEPAKPAKQPAKQKQLAKAARGDARRRGKKKK